MAATIKTKVLIISDTHCAQLKARGGVNEYPRPPFSAPLPSADLLIHCGDLTHVGKQRQYEATLDMLKDIDVPVKLVIAGNHDLTLDKDFIFDHLDGFGASGAWRPMDRDQAETKVKQARDIWTAADGRARAEGITFLDEGVHQIDLPNGARVNVYASPYTPEFCDWSFAYERWQDRFNPTDVSLSDAVNIAKTPMPSLSSQTPIDICITHGPPLNTLAETKYGNDAGCPHLLRAIMRARPLLHCFGHIHEGWGAARIEWSESANEVSKASASIEDWQNGFWKAGVAQDGAKIEKVDVDLEKAEELRGALLDLSNSSGEFEKGGSTLCVNASIMDVRYKPVNAPWIIYLDLPKR